jgi:hypothetical protein
VTSAVDAALEALESSSDARESIISSAGRRHGSVMETYARPLGLGPDAARKMVTEATIYVAGNSRPSRITTTSKCRFPITKVKLSAGQISAVAHPMNLGRSLRISEALIHQMAHETHRSASAPPHAAG